MLVDEIIRPAPMRYRSESTPGHLLHVVECGQVQQRAEGRPERVGGGQVVWYHESEPVEGRVLRAPWRFITINFDAPDLAPPTDDHRVLRAGPRTLPLARRLLGVWREATTHEVERALRAQAVLAELLMDFMPADASPPLRTIYPANAAGRWWRAEKLLRLRLERPLDLAALARTAGLSVRTTIRACKAATGQPPARRMKSLRLTYARGLLQHSDLPVGEVGRRVGYGRTQEFSRDFRKHFRQTPREARSAAPDYLSVRSPTGSDS